MRYLSVCSGIEAASVAWGPLGWKAVGVSEIEPFPCSVLKHHYPDVPNFGDMTQFEEWDIEPGSVDVLVGGTPCQSFSIAGLRGGLADGRGNLALTYCRILQKFKPRWFIWENVPGVLSSWSGDTPSSMGISPGPGRTMDLEETSDFASIIGAFSELGYGVAARILDAQYFGVPQRRRRVFVVGYLGDWTCAAEVLFKPGCVSGNLKKGDKNRKDVAGTLASRTSAGGGLGTDFDIDGGLVAGTLKSTHSNCGNSEHIVCASLTSRPYSDNAAEESKLIAYQCQGTNVGPMGTFRAGNGNETGGVPFVVGSLSCNTGPNGKDAGNFACNQSVDAGHIIPVGTSIGNSRTETVKDLGESGDKTQGARGEIPTVSPSDIRRGTPVQLSTSTGDKSHCLNAGGMGRQDYETETMVVAFSSKDHGADAGVLSPTLRAMNHTGSHANAGGQIAIAFTQNQREEVREIQSASALSADPGTHQSTFIAEYNSGSDIVAFGNVSDGSSIRNADGVSPPLTCRHGDPNSVASPSIGVRRLTPIECERLQGFPDNYTNVMHRGKQAADGNRYKSLGNSMAVPVMRWLGSMIEQVDKVQSVYRK